MENDKFNPKTRPNFCTRISQRPDDYPKMIYELLGETLPVGPDNIWKLLTPETFKSFMEIKKKWKYQQKPQENEKPHIPDTNL